jgi:hypothetical protein
MYFRGLCIGKYPRRGGGEYEKENEKKEGKEEKGQVKGKQKLKG